MGLGKEGSMSDIAGLPSLSDVSSSTSLTSAAGDTLDRDAFLNLLTTQLQNQDPLDPMSNEEFVAQLAQFSSLEQLMGMQETMEAVYLGIASMNNAAMASLVGTNVVAMGNGIAYDGGDADLHYNASGDVSSATVTIYDENGDVVLSEEIGSLDEGEGSWTWDGTDEDGLSVDPGDYTFSFTGTDADGNSVTIDEMVVGTVTEMDYSTGIPQPSVNGVLVDLADILRLTTGDEPIVDEGDPEEGA